MRVTIRSTSSNAPAVLRDELDACGFEGSANVLEGPFAQFFPILEPDHGVGRDLGAFGKTAIAALDTNASILLA